MIGQAAELRQGPEVLDAVVVVGGGGGLVQLRAPGVAQVGSTDDPVSVDDAQAIAGRRRSVVVLHRGGGRLGQRGVIPQGHNVIKVTSGGTDIDGPRVTESEAEEGIRTRSFGTAHRPALGDRLVEARADEVTGHPGRHAAEGLWRIEVRVGERLGRTETLIHVPHGVQVGHGRTDVASRARTRAAAAVEQGDHRIETGQRVVDRDADGPRRGGRERVQGVGGQVRGPALRSGTGHRGDQVVRSQSRRGGVVGRQLGVGDIPQGVLAVVVRIVNAFLERRGHVELAHREIGGATADVEPVTVDRSERVRCAVVARLAAIVVLGGGRGWGRERGVVEQRKGMGMIRARGSDLHFLGGREREREERVRADWVGAAHTATRVGSDIEGGARHIVRHHGRIADEGLGAAHVDALGGGPVFVGIAAGAQVRRRPRGLGLLERVGPAATIVQGDHRIVPNRVEADHDVGAVGWDKRVDRVGGSAAGATHGRRKVAGQACRAGVDDGHLLAIDRAQVARVDRIGIAGVVEDAGAHERAAHVGHVRRLDDPLPVYHAEWVGDRLGQVVVLHDECAGIAAAGREGDAVRTATPRFAGDDRPIGTRRETRRHHLGRAVGQATARKRQIARARLASEEPDHRAREGSGDVDGHVGRVVQGEGEDRIRLEEIRAAQATEEAADRVGHAVRVADEAPLGAKDVHVLRRQGRVGRGQGMLRVALTDVGELAPGDRRVDPQPILVAHPGTGVLGDLVRFGAIPGIRCRQPQLAADPLAPAVGVGCDLLKPDVVLVAAQ